MTRFLSVILTAGLLLVAPRPAAAQPGARPVPAGDDQDDEYRRLNLATNPVGWIFDIYSVSASYGVTRNLAVRVDATYFDFDERTGREIGVGLPLYLRRTYVGAFLEPGFIVRELDDPYSEDGRTVGPQVLAGLHWLWSSGFNVALAAGAGRNLAPRPSRGFERYDHDRVFLNGYLRFGYAF